MKFSDHVEKADVFEDVQAFITELGFTISNKDDQRPWGGFLVIEESQAQAFIETFFTHLNPSDFSGFSKLSPKILIVAPEKRLSWQYHHRRAEIWKVIGGSAGVVISESDEQTPVKPLALNDSVDLKQGQRHRLVGSKHEWGILAEIWKHTDPNHPSDEDDIVRVEDDFGR